MAEMTELKDKAIDIKWKKYVLVSDRVIYFNENYPNWCIQTERFLEWDMEIFKATVIPDIEKPERFFTWYSQAKRVKELDPKKKMDVNLTSALENAETSAVWRALAFMWIGVIDSIASADEIKKAENEEKRQETKKAKKDDVKWFNKEELERLQGNTEYLKKFATSDDLITDISKYYSVSKEMKMKIADVRANVPEDEPKQE